MPLYPRFSYPYANDYVTGRYFSFLKFDLHQNFQEFFTPLFFHKNPPLNIKQMSYKKVKFTPPTKKTRRKWGKKNICPEKSITPHENTAPCHINNESPWKICIHVFLKYLKRVFIYIRDVINLWAQNSGDFSIRGW